MRNFLFRNVSLVDKTGEEGEKKKGKNSFGHGDTE